MSGMKHALAIAIMALSLSAPAFAADTQSTTKSKPVKQQSAQPQSKPSSSNTYSSGGTQYVQVTKGYKEVDTKTLKAWIDQGKEVVIIDARSDEDDDGVRLPNAINLPYDSSESKIRAAVPNQATVIVVYCADEQCSSAPRLADRLVRMGYRNVNRYAEGSNAWTAAGNPSTHTK